MGRAQVQFNRAARWRPRRGARSDLSIWYEEVDRTLILLILLLVVIGLIALSVASPAGARQLSTETDKLPPLYFLYRQLFWCAIGLPLMIVISMLPKTQARRFSIIMAGVFFTLLLLVPFLGTSVNGARRWIGFGLTIQPSEFLKPFFAVTLAWIMSWKSRDQSLPVLWLSLLPTVFIAILLMNQPDLGQTLMFLGTWFLAAILMGMSLVLVLGSALLLIIVVVLAYFFYPVAHDRINTLLFGGEEHDQISLAFRTLTSGGLTGKGPGLGTNKYSLPEPQTDYIYSVIGEEFGLIICGLIALLYIFIFARVCRRLLGEKDAFAFVASACLAAQFCAQAMVNIGVNLRLLPSKGMTLPFISHGGSSMLALCLTMGLLLALTRRNPYLDGQGPANQWSQP